MRKVQSLSYMRLLGVGVGLHRGIIGQLAEFEQFANAAADGQGPHVTFIRGQPVGRDDRRGDSIPAFPEIIIDERLDQHLVHGLAVVVPGK